LEDAVVDCEEAEGLESFLKLRTRFIDTKSQLRAEVVGLPFYTDDEDDIGFLEHGNLPPFFTKSFQTYSLSV
jgi:hypothetical protein